jgi:hypothetical protein
MVEKKKIVPQKRNVSNSVKQAIRKEYKYKCQYCKDTETKAIHIEHIISLDKGGSNDLENLTLACERCNLKKASLNMPTEYSGILISRSKAKKKKIEKLINSKSSNNVKKGAEFPSESFSDDFKDVKIGDTFLKISTDEEHVKNFTILYKQQSKIVHNRDEESFIEHQTYKWNSLFGEQFHNVFKRMMYVNIDIIEYIGDIPNTAKKFKILGKENLIVGIRYGVNEYVSLYISDRLLNIINENSIFTFKDILYGKEIEYKEVVKKKEIENPFV